MPVTADIVRTGSSPAARIRRDRRIGRFEPGRARLGCRDGLRRGRRDRPRRTGGGDDQHGRRQRHPDHLPGAAGVRLRAGDGQRLEHDRPGARDRCRARSATGASSRASARARSASARSRCWAAPTGAVLLLVLPPSAFKAIVPVFIAIALVLVVLQPRLNRLARRARDRAARRDAAGCRPSLGVYATGVYGGYFGAAQGILLLGILGVALPQDLQRTNALKNVLAGRSSTASPACSSSSPRTSNGRPAAIIAGTSIDRRPDRRALRAPATPRRAARR